MDEAAQIPILNKAIDVMGFIADSDRGPTPREAASALGIAPTSCYRIFRTFHRRNWLQAMPEGRFGLSLGLHPLVQRITRDPLLSSRTRELLAGLTLATGVTGKISIREEDQAVTLLREASTEPMALSVQPAARFHLGYGSSGAVLLSGCSDAEIGNILRRAPSVCWEFQKPADVKKRISEVRAGRCAMDIGHYRPDIFGLSAPIYGTGSTVRASLTLTGLIYGLTKKDFTRFCKKLLETAKRISTV